MSKTEHQAPDHLNPVIAPVLPVHDVLLVVIIDEDVTPENIARPLLADVLRDRNEDTIIGFRQHRSSDYPLKADGLTLGATIVLIILAVIDCRRLDKLVSAKLTSAQHKVEEKS